MNIDDVHMLRDMVSRQAADLRWRTIPQLKIPFVEYTVPSGEDAKKVLSDLQRRLTWNPNFEAKLVTKGVQVRIKVEYRT